MSTSDVPGAKTVNRDSLGHGCWAEHKDGSLILVQSTEAKHVIFDVFDLKNGNEYRDAQEEKKFKKAFSYVHGEDKKDGVSEEWTWHDKTPFPWQKVIDAGLELVKLKQVDPSGDVNAAKKLGESVTSTVGDADVEVYGTTPELLTAAKRVAKTLKLNGTTIKPKSLAHKLETKGEKTAKDTVVGRIKNAFGALRGK